MATSTAKSWISAAQGDELETAPPDCNRHSSLVDRALGRHRALSHQLVT